MQRMTTGNSELDTVLHGGLPRGGLVVLTGPPGSGKTVLAQQIAFANAAADRPAYYYSTLSESHTKLRQHLAGFTFYDDDAIGSQVHLIQLSEYAANAAADGAGMATVVDEVVTRAFAENPSVIIIDSSKALHLYGHAEEVRTTTFDLASKISHTGAVLIFVGEYGPTDPDTAPEFAVADVILELANDPSPATDLRTLRVAKLRGSAFIPGQHPFAIDGHGIRLDIRLEATPAPALEVHAGRAGLADGQLDAMTGGGIPRGDVTLAMGPSGVGKTTLAMQFLAAGLHDDEPGLYVALEEPPAELVEKADGFGLDFSGAVDDGRLQILHGMAGLTDLDRLGHDLRTAIDQHRPRRIVLDAISSLMPDIDRTGRSPGFPTALAALLRSHGATTMLTYEIQAMGNTGHRVQSLSNLANNVLLQRYMEREGELSRVLSILKMRRSNHDKGLLQYDISPDGLTVIGEADNVHQITGWTVLSGNPTG